MDLNAMLSVVSLHNINAVLNRFRILKIKSHFGLKLLHDVYDLRNKNSDRIMEVK